MLSSPIMIQLTMYLQFIKFNLAITSHIYQFNILNSSIYKIHQFNILIHQLKLNLS